MCDKMNEFNTENYNVIMADTHGNEIKDIRKYEDAVILLVKDNTKLSEIPYNFIAGTSTVFKELMPDLISLDKGIYVLNHDERKRLIWENITESINLIRNFWITDLKYYTEIENMYPG